MMNLRMSFGVLFMFCGAANISKTYVNAASGADC